MTAPPHASELSSQFWEECQRAVFAFEQAWQRGERPALEPFVPREGPARTAVLLELVQTDAELRHRAGDMVSLIDYVIRFPELAHPDTLRALQPCERLLHDSTQLRTAVTTDLDRPTVRAPAAGDAARSVGKYELLSEVGRGSFGVVYRARDVELDRIVAVKLIRADRLAGPAESRPGVDRFLREARATAQLRHPHIVALHDAGQVGVDCFLVSAFVEGATLAERLQDWKAAAGARPTWRRLALLVQRLAEAVQHAHEHGIVHRDLKPANILLAVAAADSDELALPYVTDFGLAKRLDHEPTLTAPGDVLGTPAYMSPEQAGGDGHRVDARSDVYSLGVILYQLLTGELPFAGTSGRILQQVLTAEPRPPRLLNEAVPRDLETICLKAITKEPAGRYQSAGELAEDLMRYQRGEPVRARPLGRVGRAARWARRKPIVASLLAGLATSLVCGLTLVAWQWWRAERYLAAAREQHDQSERMFRQAFQAVHDLSEFAKAPPLQRRLFTPMRRQMLAKSLEYFQAFVHERGNDPTVAKELAQAYLAIGMIHWAQGEEGPAADSFQQAMATLDELERHMPHDPWLRREQAAVRQQAADLQRSQGHTAEALHGYEQVRSLLDGLVEEFPDDDELRFRLATVWADVGHAHARNSQEAPARTAYRRAVALCRPIVAARPDARRWQYCYGRWCHLLADLEQDSALALEAFAAYQQVCDKGDRLVTLGQEIDEAPECYLQLAKLLRQLNRARQALPVLEQACTMAAELAALPTGGPLEHDLVGQCQYEQGRLHSQLGDRAAALTAFRAADRHFGELSRAHPDDMGYARRQGVVLHDLGRLLRDGGDLPGALDALQQADAIRRRLQRAHPEVVQLRLDVSATSLQLGRLLEKLERAEEALSAYREALAQQRVVWEQSGKEQGTGRWLKERYDHLVDLLRHLGRTADAQALERERQQLLPATAAESRPLLRRFLQPRPSADR